MTERINFNVVSHRIFLGQTLLDDTLSSDRDDFRPGADFFIVLGLTERAGADSNFRAHWRQLARLTLYFGATGNAAARSVGVVARDWRENERLLGDASVRLERELFGPMRDWLATSPSLRLSLYGENRNLDAARFRLYGQTHRG